MVGAMAARAPAKNEQGRGGPYNYQNTRQNIYIYSLNIDGEGDDDDDELHIKSYFFFS